MRQPWRANIKTLTANKIYIERKDKKSRQKGKFLSGSKHLFPFAP